MICILQKIKNKIMWWFYGGDLNCGFSLISVHFNGRFFFYHHFFLLHPCMCCLQCFVSQEFLHLSYTWEFKFFSPNFRTYHWQTWLDIIWICSTRTQIEEKRPNWQKKTKESWLLSQFTVDFNSFFLCVCVESFFPYYFQYKGFLDFIAWL